MASPDQKISEFTDSGDLDEAQKILLRSLKEKRTAEACFALAETHLAKSRFNDAVYYYEEAIKINPKFHQAYGRIADTLLANGHPMEALDYYGLAIKSGPDELGYKQGFVNLVYRLQLKAFNADLKGMIIACLQAPGLDVYHLGSIWRDLLRFDPESKDLYKVLQKDNYDDFRKSFSRLKDDKSILAPFFLAGLRQLVVFDTQFERSITYLRRYLLDEIKIKPEYQSLAEALSCYCLTTEYILPVSEQEAAALPALDNAAILGCYKPLYRESNAPQLKAQLPEDLVKTHFTEFEVQEGIRPTITSMNIEDSVSLKVRDQYEEFPYPRWKHLDSHIRSEESEGYLREGVRQILVAGCGTGREAIELAAVFPNAQVLAVDLSLSSLSYAVMKAREFGVQNIEFRQGDILNLGALDRKFDYIACSGVLHHMKDPKAGMAVLSGLLKPGSIMRIALYSELARQEIVAAREVISDKKYLPDKDGIRQFRQDARLLLRINTYADITGFADYYYLSECRDLLFHVQEHRYTVEGLQDLLTTFGLGFIQFYLPQDVLGQYRKAFPDNKETNDLNNWAKFETRNPRTFREMYRFWVRKPA